MGSKYDGDDCNKARAIVQAFMDHETHDSHEAGKDSPGPDNDRDLMDMAIGISDGVNHSGSDKVHVTSFSDFHYDCVSHITTVSDYHSDPHGEVFDGPGRYGDSTTTRDQRDYQEDSRHDENSHHYHEAGDFCESHDEHPRGEVDDHEGYSGNDGGFEDEDKDCEDDDSEHDSDDDFSMDDDWDDDDSDDDGGAYYSDLTR